MTDFLSRLIGRSLGVATVLGRRRRALFEPTWAGDDLPSAVGLPTPAGDTVGSGGDTVGSPTLAGDTVDRPTTSALEPGGVGFAAPTAVRRGPSLREIASRSETFDVPTKTLGLNGSQRGGVKERGVKTRGPVSSDAGLGWSRASASGEVSGAVGPVDPVEAPRGASAPVLESSRALPSDSRSGAAEFELEVGTARGELGTPPVGVGILELDEQGAESPSPTAGPNEQRSARGAWAEWEPDRRGRQLLRGLPSGRPQVTQGRRAPEAMRGVAASSELQPVQVTIGRLDVRIATPGPSVPPQQEGARPGPRLTLDQYLQARRGGRG